MHTIRLAKPWRKRGPNGASQRVDVPDTDPDGNGGPVVYERNFNRPSGLDDNSEVFVQIDGWQASRIEIQLNGQPVPNSSQTDPPLLVAITEWLQTANTLQVRLDSPDGSDPLLDASVFLAIRD